MNSSKDDKIEGWKSENKTQTIESQNEFKLKILRFLEVKLNNHLEEKNTLKPLKLK